MNDYKQLSNAPSANDPWYVSFYPEGYCTTEITQQNTTSAEGETGHNTSGTLNSTLSLTFTKVNGKVTANEKISETIDGEKDSVQGVTTENIEIIVKYKLNSSTIISMSNKNKYDIKWGAWNTGSNYNKEKAL